MLSIPAVSSCYIGVLLINLGLLLRFGISLMLKVDGELLRFLIFFVLNIMLGVPSSRILACA